MTTKVEQSRQFYGYTTSLLKYQNATLGVDTNMVIKRVMYGIV